MYLCIKICEAIKRLDPNYNKISHVMRDQIIKNLLVAYAPWSQNLEFEDSMSCELIKFKMNIKIKLSILY